MTEPVLVEGLRVEPSAAEARRFLVRAGAAPAPARPRFERALEEALATARGLVDAKGVYVVAAGAALPGSTRFAHLERVAFCVVTIGPALEREVTARSGRGELLGALVLDAVGSAAAEAAAGALDRRIAEEAARAGLRTSCRASPGYGDWDVGGQAGVFRLVPAGRIGVRLSDGMMMEPRKSVSFAVHVAAEPERLRGEASCASCDLEDCPYRLRP